MSRAVVSGRRGLLCLQHLHEELIDELHRHLYVKATAKKTQPLVPAHGEHVMHERVRRREGVREGEGGRREGGG